MRQPIHAINGGHREMTPERIVGIGFVALLHVVAVWAIVNGLMQKYAKPAPTPPIVARLIDTKQPPPPPQPRMPTVDLPDKSLPSVPEPVVVIEQETPHTPPFVPTYEPPATPQPLPVPDTAASGVMSTPHHAALSAARAQAGQPGHGQAQAVDLATGASSPPPMSSSPAAFPASTRRR